MNNGHDKQLLKEMKRAYKFKNEGNDEAFAVTLRRIAIEFVTDLQDFSDQLELFLRGGRPAGNSGAAQETVDRTPSSQAPGTPPGVLAGGTETGKETEKDAN